MNNNFASYILVSPKLHVNEQIFIPFRKEPEEFPSTVCALSAPQRRLMPKGKSDYIPKKEKINHTNPRAKAERLETPSLNRLWAANWIAQIYKGKDAQETGSLVLPVSDLYAFWKGNWGFAEKDVIE